MCKKFRAKICYVYIIGMFVRLIFRAIVQSNNKTKEKIRNTISSRGQYYQLVLMR